MSQALEISKYSKSFVNTLSTDTFRDLRKTTGETKKVSEQWFKQRRTMLTDVGAVLDTDHVFSIPNSYGYVSHFWLEMIGDGTAVYSLGKWGIVNVIKRIKVELGSEIMCSYSGDDLAKMIHLANRGNAEVLTELQSLAGSGDVDTNPMLIPILCPGSNLVHSLDSFDVRSPAWPLGANNNPMVITITLQTGAYASTNAFVLNSVNPLRLKFFSYAVDSDNIANKTVAPTGLYYTWNFIKPISNVYVRAQTSGVEDQFTIDNVITQGELDGIVIDITSATKVTAKAYQDMAPIRALALKVRGTESLYEHDSFVEGRLNCLREWKCRNQLYNPTTGYGYFYPMSLTGRPDLSGISGNIGTKGINLNLNKPTVFMTQVDGTENYTIKVLSLYKALYNVKNDKTSITVISAD